MDTTSLLNLTALLALGALVVAAPALLGRLVRAADGDRRHPVREER